MCKILCTNHTCKSCYNKSLASSKKSSFFSAQNKIGPRMISKISNNYYIFHCVRCNHQIISRVSTFLLSKSCMYCLRKGLCTNLSCKLCYDNSFASHRFVSAFSHKNNIDTRLLMINSTRDMIFVCSFCKNDFISQPRKILSTLCHDCLYDIVMIKNITSIPKHHELNN